VLFAKAIAEKAKSPEFRVIQTSSSHEPFEVPYRKLKNDRANAFAYADSCLGNYVRQLKASGAWQNALVIIVPDHWGAYPENLTDPLARQHIPLVLTGGAIVGAPARIANTGSQSAIAPTILSLLGIQPKGFINPRNLLDSSQKGFAWMAIPEWFGIKQGENFTQIIVNTGDRACGNIKGENQAKAFIQHVYNDLDKR
jgi:phosphoglycerol transferase MdoB-like AlkP superfamily enzyme